MCWMHLQNEHIKMSKANKGIYSCERNTCINISHKLITARKRSLGQGNIFTPVCHSVQSGGVLRGVCSRGVPGPGGVVCSRGCLVETPRLLLRPVRILLECILVKNRLAWKTFPEEQASLRCDHRPGWCTAKHPGRTPPQEVQQGQVNASLQLQQNSVLSGPQLISQREIFHEKLFLLYEWELLHSNPVDLKTDSTTISLWTWSQVSLTLMFYHSMCPQILLVPRWDLYSKRGILMKENSQKKLYKELWIIAWLLCEKLQVSLFVWNNKNDPIFERKLWYM